MAEIQHTQIRNKLLEQIASKIDASDLAAQSKAGLEAHVLSRSIAAVAIKICSDADDAAAVMSVVDGFGDNGIDAIYYDAQKKALYLVQSKWSSSHSSSIESGEVLKFLQGVRDLVSLKRDRFNQKIQSRWNIIEDALNRCTSVRLIIAYPGSSKVDADLQAKIDEFISAQNDTSELFYFVPVTQREFFQYFVHEAAPPQINLTIRLAHYGLVESPLRAVYGQVSASDVAAWYKQHGNFLFSGNIRNFLGMKSEVNTAIAKTLADAPDKFWYYNNGITIIVEDLKRQAIGGSDRSIGVFECKSVTIVNGAQTVGTIGRHHIGDDSPAFLQARLIVVEDPDSLLGQQITRASNTQNKIDARNFVALDLEQERIRTELLIDKVYYEYREGEALDSAVDGFEFIEAVTTLACASAEMSYVALSKGYVGGLYADIEAAPYKALFNPSTSSKRLWSLIQLSRRIEKAIKISYDPGSPTQRGIVVHGNRFLMHCIFKRLSAENDIASSEKISDSKISKITKDVIEAIDKVLKVKYPDAYLAPLFKNVSKCAGVLKAYEVGLSKK